MVLRSSTGITCWTSFHVFIVYALAIPGLILWGIGIPSLFFFLITKNRETVIQCLKKKITSFQEPPKQRPLSLPSGNDALISLSHPKKESKALRSDFSTGQVLAFLYRCLSPKYTYWSAVISLRKFSLTLLIVGVQYVNLRVKIALLILLLVFYTEVNALCQPYQFQALNRLETGSLYLSLFSANIGILMMIEELQEHAFVIQIGLVLLNGVYCCYLVLCITVTFYDKKTFVTRILDLLLPKKSFQKSWFYRSCSISKLFY
jgi:hypothetical protein